jgi:hypothetical protein
LKNLTEDPTAVSAIETVMEMWVQNFDGVGSDEAASQGSIEVILLAFVGNFRQLLHFVGNYCRQIQFGICDCLTFVKFNPDYRVVG